MRCTVGSRPIRGVVARHAWQYYRSVRPSSPNTSIVHFLNKYGHTSVPLDFLAQGLGRRTPEILDYLDELEKQGIVKRDGDMVRLTDDALKS